DIKDIAAGLVEFCRKSQFRVAIDCYYSDDIVSVKALALPGLGREQRGTEAISGNDTSFAENSDVHSCTTTVPFPGPDPYPHQFAVDLLLDHTPKSTGKCVTLAEMGLYTVNNGKIVREEFYYPGA